MVKFCPNCAHDVNFSVVPATGEIICAECGSSLGYSAAALPAGTLVAGFRIEREIGRGGMGVVYLATQLNLSRAIALKVLSDELSSDAAFVETFFHEARAAASLSHPNIVQAYDAGISPEGIYYFAMEYIEGESLEVKLNRSGALSPLSALQLAVKISDALGYAWKLRRMCHGDIKPDNILVSSGGEIKLADLGLAKSMYEESVKRDVMVTPLYAAPEIICGNVTSANLASDIYSFGATLFHIAAGRPPFNSENIDDIYHRHLSEAPVSPSSLNHEIPEALSAVILRMLSKKPEERPSSWEEVSAALTEVMDAYRMRHVAEAERVPFPKKLLLAGSIIVLLLLAGIVFVIFHILDRKNQPAPEDAPPRTGVSRFLTKTENFLHRDQQLRRKWESLKIGLRTFPPEYRNREYQRFFNQNNLQESLAAEVQDLIKWTRYEIKVQRFGTETYTNGIRIFNQFSVFAPYMSLQNVEKMLHLHSMIVAGGRQRHLKRIYERNRIALELSVARLKMRKKCFRNGFLIPPPETQSKPVPNKPVPIPSAPVRTPVNVTPEVKQTPPPPPPAKKTVKTPPPLPPAKKIKVDEDAAEVETNTEKEALDPEKEFVELISRQVRNFSPEVLRMQLLGFSRKYRTADKAVAAKALLVSDALIEGDALANFFFQNNECLKGVPLPDIEKNASYVTMERNMIRIMITDGKVTIRKRLRLIPSVVSAVKRSICKAFGEEEYRKNFSLKLQEFIIVNSFFYDHTNAERNIASSTLPPEQKQNLKKIFGDVQLAIKNAHGL